MVHKLSVMSALPPKADMCGALRYVRLVPLADMTRSAEKSKGEPYRQSSAHLVDVYTVCDGVTKTDVK